MSNDEGNLQSSSSVNKSRTALRNSNRVSFSESINKSLPPENEYEAPSSSAATTKTTSWLSSSPTLKRNTPILFSTNRGLHLRVTSSSSGSNNNQTSTSNITGEGGGSGDSMSRTSATIATTVNSSYSITFCDLERWSTNRANTVSLEDTFTIARPAVVPQSAASGSLASNSLRFLPHKTNSVLFKGYTRFDVE